ncbi:hypothetical protein SUGI_0874000 [Cryptomeria japonica]|nr:hypothetical protein SUGI_0874000 [Cryptomeria japonica]
MPGDRNVGVAMVNSEASKNALQWAIDNLVDKRDRLVLVHVLHHSNGCTNSWKKSGSPLIPLSQFRQPRLAKQYCLTDFDAEILDMLDTVSRQKEAKIVAKIYLGNTKKKLCEAVEDLELDSLVMGSSEGPRLLRR